MAVFYEGGADAFDALSGGVPSGESMAWLRASYDATRNLLNAGQRAFTEMTSKAHSIISEFGANQLMRNLGHKIKAVWKNDIVPLLSVEEIQTASQEMQRWVMACPEVRTLYHKQLCEGYGDSYVDHAPGVIGNMHYDFRRVMNGVTVVPEEGVPYRETYYDTMTEHEHELKLPEQTSILLTWRACVKAVREAEDDMTSQYGAKL